jgi:hypothetical protein
MSLSRERLHAHPLQHEIFLGGGGNENCMKNSDWSRDQFAWGNISEMGTKILGSEVVNWIIMQEKTVRSILLHTEF